MKFFYYIFRCCCCCDCGQRRRRRLMTGKQRMIGQKTKRENLKLLEGLAKTRESKAKLYSQLSDPLLMNTEEMSNVHEIGPNMKYKTETELLQSLGYRLGSFIDDGTYGDVFKLIAIENQLPMACKRILIPEEGTDRQSRRKRKVTLTDIKSELFILQKARHPHVIQMIEHFVIKSVNQTILHIVMRYAPEGDLSELTRRSGPFLENQCRKWFAQMLSALSFMHCKGIAHRDLKLGNILLDESQDVLITDFGLSRILMRKTELVMSTTYCGTGPYMAPEVLRLNPFVVTSKEKYNAFSADVWSLGVILYHLFNNSHPFPKAKAKSLVYMTRKQWSFSRKVKTEPSPAIRDILDQMFEPIPLQRPSMRELRSHEWVREELTEVENTFEERFKYKETERDPKVLQLKTDLNITQN